MWRISKLESYTMTKQDQSIYLLGLRPRGLKTAPQTPLRRLHPIAEEETSSINLTLEYPCE